MTKTRSKLKIMGLMLTLVITVSLLGLFSFTASASAAADFTVTIDTGESVTLKDADGDGCYDIGTADELYAFAAIINNGNDGVNGELTANIVVNKNVLTADGDLNGDGSNFRVWTPIGYEVSISDREYFEGTFDGNNYTVSGLYYDGSAMYVGLFGYGYGATIRNVGILDSYMCSNYSDTSSRGYIGAVAAVFNYNGVSMENCYNKGTVIATTDRVYAGGVVGNIQSIKEILNCYNTGKVVGRSYVGGIVGYSTYSSLTDCYNTGDVSGDSYVGGLAGYSSLSKNYIERCNNTGNIHCTGNYAGGIVGYLSGSFSSSSDRAITNCYNTGNIHCTGNYIGGLAGYSDQYNSVIRNSYNVGNVSGIQLVGGIAGVNLSSVLNCYNLGEVSGTSYVGGVSGESNSEIQSCYNAGKISGGTPVGGIVGNNDYKSDTQNCYYLKDTAAGGIYGADAVGEAEVKTAEQFASGEIAYLLQGEQTEQLWGQVIEGENLDALPLLGVAKIYIGYASCSEKNYTNKADAYDEKPPHTVEINATCAHPAVCGVCGESYGEVDKTNHDETVKYENGFCPNGCYEPAILNADGCYEISNGGQLFWFAEYINTVDRTASATLTADIDLENRPWTPIGSTGQDSNNFRGVFDGQNHNIKGLYVVGGRAGFGFFGEVRCGTVKNFTIYGEVVADTDVNYVGGVIGSACGLNGTDHGLERNGATIQNIISYVNLTAKTHGIGMVGGFIGYVNHETLVENCSWYGTFDAGEYRVDSGAGGFIGRVYDTATVTIRRCAAYGTVKTAYKSGSFENRTDIYIGGFLSFSPSGAKTVLENNLWAGEIINSTDLDAANAHLSAYGTLNSDVNAINCYALEGTPYVTTGNEHTTGIFTVTSAQLLSGEIAYLLGNGWGQTIDTDDLPVVGGATVYKNRIGGCTEATYIYEYSNTQKDAVTTHAWNEGEITKNPTCIEKGTKTYTCTHNSEHTYTEDVAIDENAHKYDGEENCENCGEQMFVTINGETYPILGDITNTGIYFNHNESPAPGAWKAGDGYLVLIVKDSYYADVILYNATVDVRAIEDTVAVDIIKDHLDYYVYGTNNIYGNNRRAFHNGTVGEDTITNFIIDEDAVLNIYGDSDFDHLVVTCGRMNVYGRDISGDIGIAMQIIKSLTVKEGATLTAQGGKSDSGLTVGVWVRKETVVEGVLNAITVSTGKIETKETITFIVNGDVALNCDTFNPYPEGIGYDIVFSVPEGAGLTVPEGIRLDLDSFTRVDIGGELTVNGTLICTHEGGEATCTTLAVCDICKQGYGNIDENAHAHGSAWVTDEGEHWNECECGDKASKAPHVDDNGDNKCDTCDYAMPVHDPDDPGTTPPADNPPIGDEGGLGTGAVVGIVIGSAAVVGVGGFSLLWFVIKKKSFADLIAVFKG